MFIIKTVTNDSSVEFASDIRIGLMRSLWVRVTLCEAIISIDGGEDVLHSRNCHLFVSGLCQACPVLQDTIVGEKKKYLSAKNRKHNKRVWVSPW